MVNNIGDRVMLPEEVVISKKKVITVAVGWSLIASGQRLLLPEKHSRYTYIKVLSPPRPVVAE